MKYTTCVSVAADSPEEMRRAMDTALKSSKYAELRLDFLDTPDIVPFLESVSGRLGRTILTLRSPREGGRFGGTESERVRLLEAAAGYGPFLLDVEFNTLLGNPGMRGRLNTRTLVSWHDFRGSPSVARLRRRLGEMGRYSDWIKIVVTADVGYEAAAVLSLYAHRGKTNLVAFAMGEEGRFTRLCAMHMGCPFMYVSLGDPVAPGQYSADEVRRLAGVM